MPGTRTRTLELLAAADFFTVEVWTLRGLVRYHVLIVMGLSTRCVHVAGICPEPNGSWMSQLARNLTDVLDSIRAAGCLQRTAGRALEILPPRGESGMSMEHVDRMALVVRPKQPYVDWANSVDDGGPEYAPGVI